VKVQETADCHRLVSYQLIISSLLLSIVLRAPESAKNPQVYFVSSETEPKTVPKSMTSTK
jgi:hypothetical protein